MNVSTSTVEKLRRAFAARDETRRARGECPHPQRIWDAAHSQLTTAEVVGVVDHFIACPSCAADWRAAKDWEADVEIPAEPEALTDARRPVARWAGLAAAAAILLVGVVAVYQFVAPVPSGPVYRSAGETIRSLVPEDEVLSRDAAVLRWTPVAEDAVYSVEVGKIDLTTLVSARELGETEFTVPPRALESVEAGESIVWQVEAQMPDGRRIASEAFLNRIE